MAQLSGECNVLRRPIRFRGAALAELSIIFGFLLLCIGGATDLGRMIETRTRLNRVAYEAVRFGISLEGWAQPAGTDAVVNAGWCLPAPGTLDCSPNERQVRNRIITLLQRIGLPGPPTTPSGPGSMIITTLRIVPNNPDDPARSGTYLLYEVNLSVPFTGFFPTLIPFFNQLTTRVSAATLFRDDGGYGDFF